MLAKMTIEQTLIRARSYLKKERLAEAQKLYQTVLLDFPQNKRAQEGLVALNKLKQNHPIQNPSQEAINQLVNLYNQGQLSLVVEQAQALTKQYPEAFVVWNILGTSAVNIGMLDQAITAFKKLILLKPDYAEAYFNLGVTLQHQDKLDEAIEAYTKALSLKADYAEAYNNMGNALKDKSQLNEAIAAYKKALLIKPNYAEAYNNMGNTFKNKGQLEKAIEAYNKALSLEPYYADAYNNIGVIYQDQGKLDDAIEAYNKSITLKPDYAEAYNNLGSALKDQNKIQEAIEAYNKSISLKPDYPEAYYNMGVTFQHQIALNQAIEAYKKALSLKPDYAEAYNNMGNALKDQGKLDEAILAYKKTISLKPDYDSTRAQKLYLQAHICDWNAVEKDRKLIPELGTSQNITAPFLMFSFEDTPERHLLRSKVFAKNKHPLQPIAFQAKPINKPERIRIGYFSADFKEHPVAYLIAKVIEQHDRDKFEIFGYSLKANKEDVLGKRLKESFDFFNDVSEMSDKDVALLSRQDNIDIAIDLNGYTQNNRTGIFAYRAAPIQINYLGFPGTMGTEFMDYIIADQHLIPSTSKKYFTEKPIYLPNSYMPTDNNREFSDHPISRSDVGLPEKAFVFCCFNNNYKITHLEFDVWMRLLGKVSGSVLWLRRSNHLSDKNMIKEAQKRNIDASRLVFADRVPIKEHLTRHKLADLFIDTFAFNAHTTTTEALWAGVPVVTKQGQGFAARVAGSLLNAIGLPELVTENEHDYEELILDLANNPNKLKKIKDKIAINRLSKPLFNTELYVKHLEIGYQKAYQNYFDNKNPKTIIVDP